MGGVSSAVQKPVDVIGRHLWSRVPKDVTSNALQAGREIVVLVFVTPVEVLKVGVGHDHISYCPLYIFESRGNCTHCP